MLCSRVEGLNTRARGSEKVDHGTLIIKYICKEIQNLQNPSCPGEEWGNHGWAGWSRVSTNKDTSRPNLSDPVKTSEITFIQTGSGDVQPRELIKDGGGVASPTEPIRLGRWRRQKSVRIQQPSSAFLPTPGLNITHQWKTVCPQRRIRIKASSDYVKGGFQSDCQKLLEPEDFIYIFSFSNLCKLIIKIFCVVLFQITT